MDNKPEARRCKHMVSRLPIFRDFDGEVLKHSKVNPLSTKAVVCTKKSVWLNKQTVDGNKLKAQELCHKCLQFNDMGEHPNFQEKSPPPE